MGRVRRWLNPNQLRLQTNRLLRRWDLGLYRPSWVESQLPEQYTHGDAALPEGAEAALRTDHPRLAELRARYSGHCAAAVSAWSDLRLEGQIDLRRFRGDSQYLYQARGTSDAAYALSTHYALRHGRLGVLDRLDEDGLFGALLHDVDGRAISRDRLDAALEIEALAEWLGADALAKGRVLDIGAGYGRLVHRLAQWAPDGERVATDAVPTSTFLCEYYLGFRACPGTQVIALHEIENALSTRRFDLATNVHSFGEAPLASVRWWIERLAAADVPRLFLVHVEPELFALEDDLTRAPLAPVLETLGYRAVDVQPKYAHSDAVQRLGVFPAWYHCYERG
ncbi:MAG: putative sugar O-methyltransferase [Myxococcota bacterium]